MPFRALPLLAIFLAALPFSAVRADTAEDAKFQALIDKIWAWDMREFPEWATSLGKRDGLDRWTDESREALDRRDADSRAFLAELEKIDARKLGDKWRLDYELLVRDFREGVEGQKFPGELLALSQLGGVHDGLTSLMQQVPASRAEDFDAILARYKAWPRLVDQNIALLERGLASGVTAPRVTLAAIPAQLDALADDDSPANPVLAPFQKDSPQLTKEQMADYRKRGMETFRESVLPALKKFRTFVNEKYLPGARETIGMSAMPDGAAWYAFSARSSTTTETWSSSSVTSIVISVPRGAKESAFKTRFVSTCATS